MNKLQMLKKGSLIAIGLASITAKKADAVISGLMKKGKLNQKEGESLARKVISETMKEEKRIREKIKKQVVPEVGVSAKKVMSVVQQEVKRLAKIAKETKAKPKVKAKKKKR